MKCKKIMSLVLSSALAMSLAAPAFAADGVEITDYTKGAQVKITGTTQMPKVKVTVPSTGSVIVNPFKLKVTIGDADKTDQIISADQFIKSTSDVALEVGAAITGTVGGEVKLATASAAAATTKSAYIYFQMAEAENDTDAVTWRDFDQTKDVVLATSEKKLPDGGMVTLAAAESESDVSYAAFHLAGDAASSLAKGNWTAKDTVSASIAFTFTPVPAEGGGEGGGEG